MSASHQKRPALAGVAHVTQKICAGLPRLRTKATFRVLVAAIRAGNEKPGFRICDFTVLSNHFHFIVEAESNDVLSRGLQGLFIRLAKGLNKHWGRRGRVLRERFFATALRTMQAMRRALICVLQDARRHGLRLAPGPDPYSSGPWFRFWRERPGPRADPSPVARHRHPTLDLVLGRRIGLDEMPGSRWGGIAPL